MDYTKLYQERHLYYFLLGFSTHKAAVLANADVAEARNLHTLDDLRDEIFDRKPDIAGHLKRDA